MSHNAAEQNELTPQPQDQQPQDRQLQDGTEKPAKAKSGFWMGALSGLAVAVVAPLFTKQLRPVVRGAIKGGIVTGRYVQKVAEGVVEDFQDITAEAKAEIAKDEAGKA
jgi:Protein of unknown function (DUF5132)